MSQENPPVPLSVQLHKKSRTLELQYAKNENFVLSCEYLRVYSPSAEVKGHGPGQETLQVGKKHVAITQIEGVGNYALKLSFDDGHDTGIYSWGYLYKLAENHSSNWQNYLERMATAGAMRDPQTQVLTFDPKAK